MKDLMCDQRAIRASSNFTRMHVKYSTFTGHYFAYVQ